MRTTAPTSCLGDGARANRALQAALASVPARSSAPATQIARIAPLRHAGLHERLRAGATVADVGCGYGLAIELLAQAYPNSTFHGFDISTVALAAAQERTSTLQNVMLFNPEDEDEQPATKAYDFVLTLDAIHDIAAPEPVLATVRGSLKDDAIGYLVVDFHSKGDTARNITEMVRAACSSGRVMSSACNALRANASRRLAMQRGRGQYLRTLLRSASWRTSAHGGSMSLLLAGQHMHNPPVCIWPTQLSRLFCVK